jgi:hypothetical protein
MRDPMFALTVIALLQVVIAALLAAAVLYRPRAR